MGAFPSPETDNGSAETQNLQLLCFEPLELLSVGPAGSHQPPESQPRAKNFRAVLQSGLVAGARSEASAPL